MLDQSDQGDCHMSILFKQSEIEIEKKLILFIDIQIELILRYAITESRVFVNHLSDLVTYTKCKTNDSKHLSLIAPSNVSFSVKGGGTFGGPQLFSFCT